MATTVAVGSVSVSTNGALTNQILQSLSALSATLAGVGATPSSGGSVGNATGPGLQLNIASTASGSFSVGGGYPVVTYQGSGTLTGADSSTAVVGIINYAGGAGTVISGNTGTGPGNVSDSLGGALMSFAGGNNTVSASGNGQKINLDAGNNWIDAIGAGQMYAQDGGSSTINSSASTSGTSTAMASGGNLTFLGFGAGGDVVSASGANTNLQFLGIGGGTDSVYGGAGADTVFAGSAVYHGGTGSDLFVGGSGMTTLYGASNETVYSGSGGGDWNFASNSKDFFDAAGGTSSAMAADTVMLASGSVASNVWSANNENLTLGSQSGASTGAVVVAYGNNDSINMTNSAGGNTVVMWNVNLSSTQAFTGNTTLTGSSAGHDVVVMFGSLFGLASEGAHTITIDNWQSTDVLDLSSGYSAAQAQAATTALAGGSSFTLSDGTTVQFNGAKPTTIVHS